METYGYEDGFHSIDIFIGVLFISFAYITDNYVVKGVFEPYDILN